MMQNINLLPWRQKYLAQQKKRFWLTFFAFALALISLTLSIRLFLLHELSIQQVRNQRLSDEISGQSAKLKMLQEKNLQSKALEQKLAFVHKLQNERNNAVLLFNLLPEITPKEVMLEKVTMNKDLILIESLSTNSAHLTDMLFNLEKHQSIENVKMHSIESTENNEKSQLKATFHLKNNTN